MAGWAVWAWLLAVVAGAGRVAAQCHPVGINWTCAPSAAPTAAPTTLDEQREEGLTSECRARGLGASNIATTFALYLGRLSIPCAGTRSKWTGIAYAPNTGKLYGVPFMADSVLIVDPLHNTTDVTTLGGLDPVSSSKWAGITYAPNTGKLYGVPFMADSVLIVDPVQNTTDTSTLGGLGSGSFKWEGIAYAPNTGKLYGVPYSAHSVLIVDPVQNTTDISTLGGLGLGSFKWAGIAYAPNTGKLYGAPNSAHSVLIVDPVQNTTDTSTLGGLGSGSFKWEGIAYAPNTGKLYGAPRSAHSVLIVDPVQNTTDTSTLGGLGSSSFKWAGIAYAPNTGKLYGAPYSADSLLIVDPVQNTTNITGVTAISGFSYRAWFGIEYAPNTGKLYGVPFDADLMLVVNAAPHAEDAARVPYYYCNAMGLNGTEYVYQANTIRIYLQNNAVRMVTPGSFSQSASRFTLQDLSLHSNQITALEAGVFAGLTALVILTLHNNLITLMQPGIFTGLTALHSVSLYNNHIPSIQPGVFGGLTALVYLALSSNPLTSVLDETMSTLTALRTLLLDDTPLAVLPTRGLNELPWLNELDANPFVDSPTQGWELQLQRPSFPLYMIGCNNASLHFINDSDFTCCREAPLPNCYSSMGDPPECRDRGLGGSDPTAYYCNNTNRNTTYYFYRFGTTHVNLNCNAIQAIAPWSFNRSFARSTLLTLNLCCNDLTTVTAGTFDGLTALTHLYLHRNNISVLEVGVMRGLTALTYLSLSYNRLTSVQDQSMAELTALTTLRLYNNPIALLATEALDNLCSDQSLALCSGRLAALSTWSEEPANIIASQGWELQLNGPYVPLVAVGCANSSLTLINDGSFTCCRDAPYTGCIESTVNPLTVATSTSSTTTRVTTADGSDNPAKSGESTAVISVIVAVILLLMMLAFTIVRRQRLRRNAALVPPLEPTVTNPTFESFVAGKHGAMNPYGSTTQSSSMTPVNTAIPDNVVQTRTKTIIVQGYAVPLVECPLPEPESPVYMQLNSEVHRAGTVMRPMRTEYSALNEDMRRKLRGGDTVESEQSQKPQGPPDYQQLEVVYGSQPAMQSNIDYNVLHAHIHQTQPDYASVDSGSVPKLQLTPSSDL